MSYEHPKCVHILGTLYYGFRMIDSRNEQGLLSQTAENQLIFLMEKAYAFFEGGPCEYLNTLLISFCSKGLI